MNLACLKEVVRVAVLVCRLCFVLVVLMLELLGLPSQPTTRVPSGCYFRRGKSVASFVD